MNHGIVIEGKKVRLSDKIKSIIKELAVKNNFLLDTYLKNIDDNVREYKDISYLIDSIIGRTIITSEISLESNNAFDSDLQSHLIELCKKFKEFYQKYPKNMFDRISASDILDEFYYNNNLPGLEDIINLVYEINTTKNTMYLLRDLNNYKDDCIKNMQYFMDDKTIEQFNIEYSKALKVKDIPRLKELLNIVNKLIEKEWEKNVNNYDKMTDENFCFIGHSTCSSNFKGSFNENFVSCSLYNQDVNDTYRHGFGFMFNPQNIIGAHTNDMYINNNSHSKEDVCQFSSFAKMYHPKRMLEECKQIKKENPNEKIYNEVVLDNFNPIGIFCFTCGPKEFDYNYKQALKLQQNFPNLKIYTFDKYKTNKDENNKLELINNVRKCGKLDINIDSKNIDRYNYFFDKYGRIEKDCSIEDVKALYIKNEELLSIYNKEPEELFTRYNSEEIVYIIKYNINYNLEYILKGNIKPYSLTQLSEYYNYRNELDKYYPGLGHLITLVNKINIDEKIVEEIKMLNPITIDSINNQLSSKLLPELEQDRANSEERLQAFKNRFEQLTTEHEKAQSDKQKYDYYMNLNRWKLNYIKKDYEDLVNDINANSIDSQNSIIILKNLNNQLRELESNKEIEANQKYDTSYYKLKLDELNNQTVKLKKHPFINRKKIKELNNEIESIKSELSINENNFETNKKFNIHQIESQIVNINTRIDQAQCELDWSNEKKQLYQEQMNNIIKSLKEEYNADTFEEAKSLIEEAEIFIQGYDMIEIYNIERELEEVMGKVKKEETNISKINDQIEEIKVR